MACEIISGITYNCLTNVGGASNVWLTNYENITGYTANSIGTVTAVSLSAGTSFVEFQFNRGGASLAEETTINIENGTTFNAATLTFRIPRREAAKRAKLQILLDGQPKVAGILKDFNGLYWAFGFGQDNSEGAYVTALTDGTGVAKTDANQYEVTLVAESPKMSPEVDAAIITSITS